MSRNIVRDYKIIGKLGQGGMGQVWLAEHQHLKRKFALKMLSKELREDQTFAQRFNQEARMQASLDHPNIVRVTDFFFERGHYFMVSEYVKGHPLDALIQKKGAFPEKYAVHILQGLLSALNHAHQNGVIHRDVKPGNLIITKDNQVKVTDFGLASMAGPSGTVGDNRIVGSPHHMSPEQIRNPAVMDHRLDVYAVGVVLFEMLTGKMPYDGATVREIWDQHLTAPTPNPRTLNPVVNPTLAEMTVRALEKDPDHRFAGCGDFLEQLKEYGKELERRALRQSSEGVELAVDGEVSGLELDWEAAAPKEPDPPVPPSPASIAAPDQAAQAPAREPQVASPKPASRKRHGSARGKPTRNAYLPPHLKWLKQTDPLPMIIQGVIIAVFGIGLTWVVNPGNKVWGLPFSMEGVSDLFAQGLPDGAVLSSDAVIFSITAFLLSCALMGFKASLPSNTIALGMFINLISSALFGILMFFVCVPSVARIGVQLGILEVFTNVKGYHVETSTALLCTMLWYGALSVCVAVPVLANRLLLPHLVFKARRRY